MKLFMTPPNNGFSVSDARVLSKGSLPLQSVRSLSASRRQVLATSTNVGNLIHCEAVAKTFEIDLRHSASGSIERLYKVECKQNVTLFHSKLSQFDAVAFSFANLISLPLKGREKQYDERFGFLQELIEAINIPIFILGMGMQDAITDPSACPISLVGFLKALDKKVAIWGVRGVETERFLHSLGCSAAEALGCPSMYVFPESIFGMKPIESFEGLHGITAGYLDRRHLLGHDPKRLDLLHRLQESFKLSYVFQNDLYTLQELEEVEGLLEDSTNLCNKSLLEEYFLSFNSKFDFESYHFFRDPRSWREFASNKSFYFGDRFHGGVAAIQVGRPSLFVWSDLRVRELTGHFNLPSVSIDVLLKQDPIELMANAASKCRLNEMKEVYENRAQQYFKRTSEFKLFPVHDRYKKKRRLASINSDLEKDLDSALLDYPKQDESILAALRLFSKTDYSLGVIERLLGACSPKVDSSSMSNIAQVLSMHCSYLPGWNENLIINCCRILMRDSHYSASVTLLETVCLSTDGKVIPQLESLLIEALALSGNKEDADVRLQSLRSSHVLNSQSITRLERILGRI